jgi:hypothetical protein
MQTEQLWHLAKRAEGRTSSKGVRDVLQSVGGGDAVATRFSVRQAPAGTPVP